MMRTVKLRVALAAVSVLVAAWLGVLLRDHELGTSAADNLGDPGLREGEGTVEQELERLHDAEFLNPTSRWLYLRAFHLTNLKRSRAAIREAEALTRREPQNAEAWAVLALAAERDPRRAAAAVRRLRRLSPVSR